MLTIDDIQIFVITKDRASFLDGVIQNILSQTVVPKYLTVLDNESDDRTELIVRKYADEGVIYKKTFGHRVNYSVAVQEAKKPYTLIFHDDDRLNLNYLEMVLNILNRHKNLAFVTSKVTQVPEDTVLDLKNNLEEDYYLFPTQYSFAKHVYFYHGIGISSCVFRTDLLKKYPFRLDKYGKFFDWPYLVGLSSKGECALISDTNACFATIHENQWTNDKTSPMTLEQIINWDLCFYNAFVKEGTRADKLFFSTRVKSSLENKCKAFMSEEDLKEYDFEEIWRIANSSGLFYKIKKDFSIMDKILRKVNFLAFKDKYKKRLR